MAEGDVNTTNKSDEQTNEEAFQKIMCDIIQNQTAFIYNLQVIYRTPKNICIKHLQKIWTSSKSLYSESNSSTYLLTHSHVQLFSTMASILTNLVPNSFQYLRLQNKIHTEDYSVETSFFSKKNSLKILI